MLTKETSLASPLLPDEKNRLQLIKAADQVNLRFGDYTLYPATLLGMSIIRPEVNGYFGDKSYRLKYLNLT